LVLLARTVCFCYVTFETISHLIFVISTPANSIASFFLQSVVKIRLSCRILFFESVRVIENAQQWLLLGHLLLSDAALLVAVIVLWDKKIAGFAIFNSRVSIPLLLIDCLILFAPVMLVVRSEICSALYY
jgi:hypothetical protein